MLSMGAAAISSAFLVALLAVYVKNHRQLRAPFTFGLVFFASLLLIQNLGSIYFDYMMSQAGIGSGIAIPMAILEFVELVGFAALFVVTWH
jgi:hypothetical protein